MTTLTMPALASSSDMQRPATASTPVCSPPTARLNEHEIDLRADWAGAKATMWIILGLLPVSFILAVIMYGWELAALCTIGLTLYSLVFGAPFWLAVIDAKASEERSRLGGEETH